MCDDCEKENLTSNLVITFIILLLLLQVLAILLFIFVWIWDDHTLVSVIAALRFGSAAGMKIG